MHEFQSFTYNQLPDRRLAEIFQGCVDSHCDEEATIDMFLLHATFAFLDSGSLFPLSSSGFPLLPRFFPFEGGIGGQRAPGAGP